jgi:hypothetical protein
MVDKLHINEFIKSISDVDIILAVQDYLHFHETGKRLYDRTVTDDIYENYMLPIGCDGASGQFASYDVICRELAKRCVTFINSKTK